MFKNLMNNYYYGKSGKGDFTPDDMPETRWQLFLETLRTRFSQLIRLNLMYLVIWIPTLLVIGYSMMTMMNVLSSIDPNTAIVETADGAAVEPSGEVITTTTADGEEVTTALIFSYETGTEMLRTILLWTLLILIPCIAITGPATAGVAYVTRNWSRDEHAFIWSDFKDAVKENWKQSLVISLITGLLPVILYLGWNFYGELAVSQVWMIVPQVLVLMISILWAISVTYMHPLIVTYRLKLRDVIRNALILAVARLPMSVGIRLLHCVPVVLLIGVSYMLGYLQWGIMLLFAYYVLIGFSLSRFVSASFTNSVFDKMINPKIEGATINRGLREQDEEDDEDDEDEEEEEEEEDE